MIDSNTATPDPRLDAIKERWAAQLPDDARMDAYYYGFDRTGSGPIDAILSAVAVAGKGSHHTESWGDESDHGYYKDRAGLPDAKSAIDLIQKTAQQATDAANADFAYLLSAVQEQAAQITKVRELAEEWRYKGEFGWGAWQEGHGPDPEGTALDHASSQLLAALAPEGPKA